MCPVQSVTYVSGRSFAYVYGLSLLGSRSTRNPAASRNRCPKSPSKDGASGLLYRFSYLCHPARHTADIWCAETPATLFPSYTSEHFPSPLSAHPSPYQTRLMHAQQSPKLVGFMRLLRTFLWTLRVAPSDHLSRLVTLGTQTRRPVASRLPAQEIWRPSF